MNALLDFANIPHKALVLFLPLFLAIALWFQMRSTDPYGLFHLSLNKVDSSSSPVTEWLNMGYWRDTTVFPEAAQALALKLIAAANLKPGGSVLDVGHGTGESLLLLLSEPSLPRPSHLVGITSLELHHQRSLERVQKRQAVQTQDSQPTKVDLYHGDAVYDGLSPQHPLCPGSTGLFDSILALDCAYHFDTRRTFLEQSFQKLAPGGRVALADICFSAEALESTRTKIITSIARIMPPQNIVSDADYVASMKDIGYVNVTLEDITPDVFPHFIAFLKSRGIGWWIFGSTLQWYTSAGATFVIVSGQKSTSDVE